MRLASFAALFSLVSPSTRPESRNGGPGQLHVRVAHDVAPGQHQHQGQHQPQHQDQHQHQHPLSYRHHGSWDSQDTCNAVARLHPAIAISWPSSAGYAHEQSRYWSTGCAALRPSCVLYPADAREVAGIVAALANSSEPFAVKSGGHNANPGFSSVHAGPLISTKRLNHVVLDREAGTVAVGPGNRWEDVTAALDGTGFTVVGGRVGDVGVGGYLLGGGLSFLSTQYGWAANNVRAYELVLANATVTTVTADSYPDLFTALKGGGGAFGIVTSFVLEARPTGPVVWGGRYLIPSSARNDGSMLRAIRDFTRHYPDPRAGIIAVHNTAAFGLVDVWLMFLFWDGPAPPPGVFDNFTALGPFVDTTGTKTLDRLLRENDWGIVKGSSYSLATEMTPLPRGGGGGDDDDAAALRVLEAYQAHWRAVSRPVRRTWGLIGSIVYQPLPRSVARAARSRGGDLLDLDDNADRIIIELDYSFWYRRDADRVDAAMRAAHQGIRALVEGFVDDGTLPADPHLPLFMNDAGYEQDYFGRLRPERRELARRVRDAVDPGGMWAGGAGGRAGGFRM